MLHLLDALALIAPPKLRLIVWAELGEHAATLGMARRITLLGGVEHVDLPSLYQRATRAVFPFAVARDSDQRGFGRRGSHGLRLSRHRGRLLAERSTIWRAHPEASGNRGRERRHSAANM